MPKISKDKLLNAPVKNAKGLGSAHHGVEHWNAQKITALANLPLIGWFIVSILSLYQQGASYELFTAWVAAPLNTILLISMFVSVFYHAKLGFQTIVEDYISCLCFRKLKLIGAKLTFAFALIAAIVSVLKIAFTAGL